MGSNVLNKPKQGVPFRKDCTIMMDIPENYDDNVTYHRTDLKLSPPNSKENLDHNGSSTRPQQPAEVCWEKLALMTNFQEF